MQREISFIFCFIYQDTEMDVERRATDVQTVLRLCEVKQQYRI